MKKATRNFIVTLIIDFLLLFIALFAVQLFKRGNLEISQLYWDLLKLFFITWIIVSIAMNKFRDIDTITYYQGFLLIIKSNFVILFIISFAIVGLHLIPVSRVQTFGSCVLFFLLEGTVFSLFYQRASRKNSLQKPSEMEIPETPVNNSYMLLVVDGLLLIIAFFVMNYLKRANFVILPRYDQLIMILYAIWLPVSLITLKFDRRNFNNFYNAFTPCVKTIAIMASVLAVIVFAFRLFYFSRLQVFGTLAVFLIFEAIVFRLFYLYRKSGKGTGDIESIEQVRAKLDHDESYRSLKETDDAAPVVNPVEQKLNYALEFFSPELFEFIREKIDLLNIDRSRTAVLSTDNIFNIQAFETGRLRLLINLHKVNDLRWLNRYFLEVHNKIKRNGYFVGKVHTIDTHRQHFVNHYPGYLGTLLYGLDFIWRRVFPKLPLAKKVYFAITQGRNRMISKAELYGRLYFCGFKLIAEKEIENRLFFIAQKIKRPSLNQNPTYGPIVTLDRRGYNGNFFKVYKFRTMHPYSEYLQDFVFQKSRLQRGGKFNDDFRLTSWGRFMRENWLDEIPMIYNWIKGDLQLFGVRPLSTHFYDLYTDELKELRKKVKPGLVPPFYADLPETLNEIIESEIRYIKRYLEQPFKTQCIYLWRSFINIVFKGARSH